MIYQEFQRYGSKRKAKSLMLTAALEVVVFGGRIGKF
jgi:hypothetical protein